MSNFDKQNLHHAYICVGDKEQIKESVLSFIEKDLGVSIKGNSDIRFSEFVNFGIDDARELNKSQLKKSVMGGKMVFVVSIGGITTEAQNSLLKMFEEPTEDTHFFIITPSDEMFLPTLLSRVEVKKYKDVFSEDIKDFVVKFLKSNKSKRLDLLKDVITEKDKVTAIKILNELERSIYEENGVDKESSYEAINFCRKYINDRGSSIKMLLEYLSLNV